MSQWVAALTPEQREICRWPIELLNRRYQQLIKQEDRIHALISRRKAKLSSASKKQLSSNTSQPSTDTKTEETASHPISSRQKGQMNQSSNCFSRLWTAVSSAVQQMLKPSKKQSLAQTHSSISKDSQSEPTLLQIDQHKLGEKYEEKV